MLNENNLQKLNRLIRDHAGEDEEALLAAVADLQTAITAQALLIHRQIRKLNQLSVNAEALSLILSANSLSASLSRVGRSKQNPFRMEDVANETKALADNVANANDFANILTSVVNVARVFI